MPAAEGLAEALRPQLLKVFPAALLGRLVTIAYYPLGEEVLARIVRLQLERVRKRIEERHRVPFAWDDAVIDLIRKRCTEVESGGRMIDAILTNTLLPELSRGVLDRAIRGEKLARVTVGTDAGGFTYAFE
jgi:type VI secretion system protein VasG